MDKMVPNSSIAITEITFSNKENPIAPLQSDFTSELFILEYLIQLQYLIHIHY